MCVGTLCRATHDCENSAECADTLGECLGGVCEPGCEENTHCGDPAIVGCVEGDCLFRCNPDRDTCDSDESCVGGYCVPNECSGTGTEGCPDGQRCSDGACVPYTACNDAGECDDPALECIDGICEPREGCISDRECAASELCIGGFCADAVECDGPDGCEGEQDCIGGLCVEGLCRGPEDCTDDEVCEGGECLEYVAPAAVETVIILTNPGTILPDQTIQFTAVALDGDGNVVIGAPFRWTSSNGTAAGIGETDGLATGGAGPGSTEITASVAGFDDVTDTVPLNNPGAPVEAGVRVLVTERETGLAVDGATVIVNGVEDASDEAGIVHFAEATSPFEIHVYEAGSDPVSLYGATTSEVAVALGALSTNTTIGGFTGGFDYTFVTSEGDVEVGLAGSSLAGGLVDLDLTTLLGDGFVLEIPFVGDFPIPGGFTIVGGAFGFEIRKDVYQAQALDGLRFAWGMAGRIPLQVIIDGVGGGGGGGTADIIATILPFFESFEHGLRPALIEELDRIVDSADYDNDGDTAELIADYESFDEIDLTPATQQSLRTEVLLPEPPVIDGTPADLAVLIAGTAVESVGFVPLGINAASDEGAGFEEILLRSAPPHSGLSAGDYAILALTFDSEGAGVGADGIDLPTNVSGRMVIEDTLPTRVEFGGDFSPLPEGSSWDSDGRTVDIDDVGADLYRVRIAGSDGTWTIYSADPGEIVIPEPSGDLPDPVSMPTIIVEALFTSGDDLDDLADPSGVTLRDIDAAIVGFGRVGVE